MSRRPHPSQRFMAHAQDASRNDVLQTETSKSLRQVLRAARATGALALAGRRLRELPVESYAPTPDDLDAIACKTPPLWSDVVAAYRYQRVLCESGTDSASSLNLNLPGSRRWRLHETASPRRRHAAA